jgi:enoyl-[acyl-carrier protein] reductase I
MKDFDFGLLKGKKGLITGIANNLSISYHIAKAAKLNGAEICCTYPSDRFKSRVETIANDELDTDFTAYCDVTNEESIDQLVENIKSKWGKLDFIIHSIAFSDKNELRGRYIDTSLPNFLNAMNISCYSLTLLAKKAEFLMKDGGSIITLSYYGSQKVIPSYNVMGIAKAALESSVKYLAYDMGPKNIRVNAISAGPISTLAASAIGDFKTMLQVHEKNAPLRRNVTQQDVAGSALYLISNLSSGVTGEIHYTDCGYNIVGFNI